MSLEKQLYDKIVESINPGDKKQSFLLATAPIEWDWGNDDIAKKYNLVGKMPQLADGNPYFKPGGNEIFEEYKRVILAANPGHNDQYSKALDDIEREISKAQKKNDNDIAKMNRAMAAEKDKPGFNEEEWKKQHNWTALLDANQREFNKLTDRKNALTEEPLHDEAKQAITKEAGNPGFEEDDNGVLHAVYMVTDDGTKWARDVRLGTKGVPKKIEFSMGNINLEESATSGDIEAGLKAFFIKVFGAKGNVKHSSLEKEIKSMKASINFKAITSVGVNLGGWYKSGYLRQLASEDHWTTNTNAKELFKEFYIVTGFVAVYGQSLSIEMSEEAKEKTELALKGGLELSIPPFVIGEVPGLSADAKVSGDHTKSKLKADIKGNTVTIGAGDTVETAQILGVYIQKPVEV